MCFVLRPFYLKIKRLPCNQKIVIIILLLKINLKTYYGNASRGEYLLKTTKDT